MSSEMENFIEDLSTFLEGSIGLTLVLSFAGFVIIMFKFCLVLEKAKSYPKIDDIANIDANTITGIDIRVKEKFKQCAVILRDLKKELPQEEGKKVNRIICVISGDGVNTLNVGNIDHRDIATDEHVIFVGEDFLKKNFTPVELRALLAHEISHITLCHFDKRDTALRLASYLPLQTSILYTTIMACRKSLFGSQEGSISSVITSFIVAAIIAKLFSIYSKKLELQADRASIQLSNDAPALISGLEKFEATQKKSPFVIYCQSFFSAHPDIKARQKALETNYTDSTSNSLIKKIG